MTSPAAICQAVPEAVDDDAAAMTQPFAVGLHALSRAPAWARTTPSRSSAAAASARSSSPALAARAGRGRVVALDIDAGRLETARALGAHEAVDASGRDLAELMLELTDGVGFDVVIEASGAPHAPAAAIASRTRAAAGCCWSGCTARRASST